MSQQGSYYCGDNDGMVSLKSRRLEVLFGAPLDALGPSHLQGLVSSSVAESFDLDYKRDLYGRTDAERRKIAGDVAALANTAGGVIILGVDEDDQARAIDAPGIELSDDENRRMRQTIASLVAPIPVFDIIPIPLAPDDNSTTDNRGFYVIAVPRSPSAPHAVLVNDALRFPKRNGSTTRYLSEPEVAFAYRDRMVGRDGQFRRIEEIEYEVFTRLNLSEHAWVIVSLVPDLLGDFTISQRTYQQFKSEILGKAVSLFNASVYTRAWTGRHRVIADGTNDRSPRSKWGLVELHSDGSGAYGLQVADLAQDDSHEVADLVDQGQMPRVRLIDDESVAIGILSGLISLAKHARDRAAVGGGVLVRAQLVPVSTESPVELGHRRMMGGSRSQHPVTTRPHPAETAAAVDDLVEAGPELVAVACRLLDDLGQSFGIPELGQFTQDGQIRLRYWFQPSRPSIVRWAQDNSITVIDR